MTKTGGKMLLSRPNYILLSVSCRLTLTNEYDMKMKNIK
jgi:hypothetical protein